MIAASVAVIIRKYPEASVGALFGVVVVQGFGYGLIFDINFFLRNLSVIGGLLMVLSDSLSKKKNIFAGLPSISETDKRIYFQVRACGIAGHTHQTQTQNPLTFPAIYLTR